MTLEEIKENFLVLEELPSTEVFINNKYHSILPTILDNKEYFVVFRTERESRIYTFLQSTNDYKVKEDIFGIIIDKGYAYSTNKGIPSNLQLGLPKKWTIEDNNVKRDFEVIITDIDQENDQLLHELYSKTRDKK